MTLAIHYSLEDRSTAARIGRLCDDLQIPHFLHERSDWLAHALCREPRPRTHLLVVVSPANEGSWWVPFQLGRAAEDKIPVFRYLSGELRGNPGFLGGGCAVRDLDSLRARLGKETIDV